MQPAESGNWWGDHELEVGGHGTWRIGDLTLRVARRELEWRVGWQRPGHVDQESGSWSFGCDNGGAELENNERHVFRRTRPRLRLDPALADRPVVTSPVTPIYLLEGEAATLYVGSPLWVRLRVHDEQRTLAEIAIRQPSDTWFGPSTLEGELCYATRSQAALGADNLPLLPRRAVTPLRIRNQAEAPLRLERLKLPVPYLSLYESEAGRLWTNSVTMTRDSETELASFETGKPPAEAGALRQIAEPREVQERGTLIRAFSSLLDFKAEDD